MARKLREDIEAAADAAGGADEPASKVADFLDCIAKYDKEFTKWEKRVEKILKRYRDEGRENRTTGEAKFNILWSNVQTLIPATFSKLPKPDVSRRFRDQDPVGRVGGMILERSLEFEIDHYQDYRATLRQCVHDRFLGGRGTAWIRYEPHFKGAGGKEAAGDDGVQITEDTDEAPVEEAIDYECAPVDYVHWRDFGHNVARTWEEVTRVWRKVYMSKDAVTERFGAEVAKTLPYDATPDKNQRADKSQQETQEQQALIFELWDKSEGRAYWFSKSQKKILDEKDDPLGLQEFFPCPRPLYSTLTNETLVPVPDFTLYQDQANELDVLADRIDGLAKMLQLKGVYDASIPELARLFTEGENGTLIPGKNWAAFAEKNGLKGSLQLVELKPIAEALSIAAQTMEQVKAQVYEITGISDIVRGQTAASETATAQQIKGQYASLRLRSMQDEVARFATECLQLKAQVICGKFSPSTIAAISAADQLSPEDKPLVFTAPAPVAPPMPGMPMPPPQPPQPTGPAMALLIGQERLQDPAANSPNPMRSFRIEVAADTLVQLDEQQEKADRLEFVGQVGQFIEKAAPVVAASPVIGPLVMELLKFGVRSFKVGKGIEGQFDSTIEKMKQEAANPQQKPDPEMAKVQAEQQARQAELQHEQQKAQAEAQVRQAEAQATAQREAAMAQAEHQREMMRLQAEDQQAQREDAFNRWKVEQDNRAKIEVAEIGAKATLQASQIKAAQDAENEVNEELSDGGADKAKAQTKRRAKPIDKLAEMHAEQMKAHGSTTELMGKVVDALSKPKRIVRGPDGRAQGVETVQ